MKAPCQSPDQIIWLIMEKLSNSSPGSSRFENAAKGDVVWAKMM
jgi:hypothetical protein